MSGPGAFQFGIFFITLIILSFFISVLSGPSPRSNSFLTSFNHSTSLWCSFLSLHIPLQSVCISTEWNFTLAILTVCSCHVTYAFQSESALCIYSCLNLKKLLAQSRREIWRLSDYNWTRTQKHLVCKRTLNHLAKWLSVCLIKWFETRLVSLAKWSSVRLPTKWFWVRAQLQSVNSLLDNMLFLVW